MKLKILSAIAKISIITAIITTSTGVSSTAETLRDIQFSSSLNKNNNKEYRNKQNNLSLVGRWKSVVYKQGQVVNLFTNFKSDGTHDTTVTAQVGSRKLSAYGTWKYSGNILTKTNHTNSRTSTERSRIKWISKDEFTSTDNEGFQITYYRDNSTQHCINIQNEFLRHQCEFRDAENRYYLYQ